jgi:putative transposase
MRFQDGHIYHVFNQGNNHQKIFFNRDNYLFFVQKIRTHILPHADILAWCLMPNHFHLEIYVNKVDIDVSGGATQSRTPTTSNSLNKSIGIMLASYTRAINKQNKSSGSLFRSKTKAECVTCLKGITPSFYTSSGTTLVNINNPEKQYPQILFDYIHQNPVKANLVANPDEWEFSSAKDYSQNRANSFVNKALARTFFDNEK